MKKFWKWTNQSPQTEDSPPERTLFLSGTIAEDSWFDDDYTPQMFLNELNSGEGDITVWINSPGGDCVAAAQIYNMIQAYRGNVTVKIDGIAASAASVIAMAGDKVLMSPVAMMMIHNPATIAAGDHNDMQKAIDMLDGVKESIINAYEKKTGLSRAKLSHLMEAETWMDANTALDLGFADGLTGRNPEGIAVNKDPMLFMKNSVDQVFLNKLEDHYKPAAPTPNTEPVEELAITENVTETGRTVSELTERLFLMKKFMEV